MSNFKLVPPLTKNKTNLGGGHLELVHHVGVEVLRDLGSIEVAARY